MTHLERVYDPTHIGIKDIFYFSSINSSLNEYINSFTSDFRSKFGESLMLGMDKLYIVVPHPVSNKL